MATLIFPALVEAAASAGISGLGASGIPLLPGVGTASKGWLIAAQVAGGLFDSLFIFPKLFAQPSTEGPRLGDLQIQEHSEGASQNRYYGREVPVAGTLVWATRLREVEDPHHGGGKGGSGGEYLTFRYFVSLGIQFGRGEIAEFRKVWADGKDFFDSQPDFDEESDQISAETDSSALFGGLPVNYLILRSDLDSDGPDLSIVKSGKSVLIGGYTGTTPPFTDGETWSTVNGFGDTTVWMISATGGTVLAGDTLLIEGTTTPYEVQTNKTLGIGTPGEVELVGNLHKTYAAGTPITVRRGASNNNGKFKCVSSQFDTATRESYLKLRHFSERAYPFAAQAAGTDTVTVFQSQPTHKESQVARISFQTGTADQEPDALLIEYETQGVGDAGQVYACRGRSMMWLEDLEVTDFGNRPPNFEALPSVNPEDPSLATAIGKICEHKGLAAEEYDVSGVSGTLGGFADRGPQPGKKTLSPLLAAFQITARDENGVLIFKDRSAMTFVDVDADLHELGVHDPDGDAPQPVLIKDAPERSLPRRIDVKYIDPDNDWKTGSRHAKLARAATGETAVLDFPIVFDKDEAQQIADRSLALIHATRRGFRGTIVPRLAQTVREGSGVNLLNAHGRNWPVLITSIERGANMLLWFEALYEDQEALVQEGEADGSQSTEIVAGGGSGATQTPPDVLWHCLDIPALRDQDADQAGRYIAAANADQGIDARGFVVYESLDGGASYAQIGQIGKPATMGDLVTAPSSAGIEHRIPDRATTFRVRLFTQGGKPSSVTLAETTKGRNRFLIGDELIGSADVVLVSTDDLTGYRTYDLSTHLRGLADTDDAMTHAVGDRVIWLDGPGIHFLPANVGAIGHERFLKVVANGGNPEEAFPAPVTLEGRNIQPYRVVQIHGERDGANNLTIRWQPQTRAIVQFLDQGEPLGEEIEKYRVDILDAPGGNILRTFNPTVNSQFYPAPLQTADGITPGDPVDAQVRQLSKRLHWGRAREETV